MRIAREDRAKAVIQNARDDRKHYAADHDDGEIVVVEVPKAGHLLGPHARCFDVEATLILSLAKMQEKLSTIFVLC